MTRPDASRAALRGRPFLFACLAVAAVVLLLVARRKERPPNVLLVTIDTMRADAVGPDTPALAELAARGRRFEAARTPAPLTLPAHATILSGLLPAGHGLRDNTAPALQEGLPLLAQEFSDAGYATAAFVASGVLDARYGLDRGFDEYRGPPAPPPGVPRFPFLDAAEQVDRVSRWIEARPKDRPFFVWMHLWDPHNPYRPFAGDARRAGTAGGDPPRDLYLGEVRRADAAVEAVLALVDPGTTVVVVTSDHGESLGEHGESTHGHLCYGATMDIPLVLAGPGVPAGAEKRPCSLEDLAPTLRALCGFAPRPGDGRDLLALPAERVLVGESLYANRLYGWAQQAVATDGRFRLVDGGPRLELFDVEADPAETAPLRTRGHEAYERLDRALAGYRARHPGADGPGYSPEGTPYGSLRIPRNRLLAPADNRRLRDVRANLPRLATLYGLQAAIAARDEGAVRRLLPAIVAWAGEDETNPAPCLAQGRALLIVLEEPARAKAALEEAARRGYASADLARLIERAGRSKKGG